MTARGRGIVFRLWFAPDLHRRAKSLAALDGQTMSQLVLQAVATEVERREAAIGRRPPTVAPLSADDADDLAKAGARDD